MKAAPQIFSNQRALGESKLGRLVSSLLVFFFSLFDLVHGRDVIEIKVTYTMKGDKVDDMITQKCAL